MEQQHGGGGLTVTATHQRRGLGPQIYQREEGRRRWYRAKVSEYKREKGEGETTGCACFQRKNE
jgi:hypothetical protein